MELLPGALGAAAPAAGAYLRTDDSWYVEASAAARLGHAPVTIVTAALSHLAAADVVTSVRAGIRTLGPAVPSALPCDILATQRTAAIDSIRRRLAGHHLLAQIDDPVHTPQLHEALDSYLATGWWTGMALVAATNLESAGNVNYSLTGWAATRIHGSLQDVADIPQLPSPVHALTATG